jgi:hypothetical protein
VIDRLSKWWSIPSAKVTWDDTDRALPDEQARRLEPLNDRERIAMAMHDTVVHRIFEAWMVMEGAPTLIGCPLPPSTSPPV